MEDDVWFDSSAEYKDILRSRLIQKDWQDEFYVDLVTIDSSDSCPSTHPEMFIFDIWPGIAHSCDCTLAYDGNGGFEFNDICGVDEDDHKLEFHQDNDKCFDVRSVPPII